MLLSIKQVKVFVFDAVSLNAHEFDITLVVTVDFDIILLHIIVINPEFNSISIYAYNKAMIEHFGTIMIN